jgi:hypothetical protein
MLFHFEMSSNEVRRNSDFIFLISAQYNNTSKPICLENMRRALAFFNARLLIDPRRRANWHLTNNLHIKPKQGF